MSDTSAALAQLQRLFGNLDKDVLGAVLEVCGGDAKEAAKYLQAQDGGGYDPRTVIFQFSLHDCSSNISKCELIPTIVEYC
jgi:hypothetical protein